jgi:acyl-CoA dehydrogenase
MDVADSPEVAAFRQEVREFLAAHAEPKRGDERDWSRNGATTDPDVAADYRRRCHAWQRTLFDHGWAGITWPKKFGGRGGTPIQQVVFNQELAQFDATSGFLTAAQALVGPTIMQHGTDAQRERYLGPLLSGDETWCQLFSEPNAGSDLANLATRAVADGDEYVVTGQKVWTSSAQHARFGILIARTNPDAPKHRGITFFIVDMTSPGIDVRPLVQAQGVAHFNEVFLDEVRIPAENVVGAVNDGWNVTKTTLRNESSMIAGAGQATSFVNVVEAARAVAGTNDPLIRQELAKAWIGEQLLRYLQLRNQTALATGRRELFVHGSLVKNLFTRSFSQRVGLIVDLQGPAGTLWDDAPSEGFWQYQFLNQFASKIGGGTEQVHRNNLAEQVLGLPREQRDDLDRPWNARD